MRFLGRKNVCGVKRKNEFLHRYNPRLVKKGVIIRESAYIRERECRKRGKERKKKKLL